jgi:hypothetical protein
MVLWTYTWRAFEYPPSLAECSATIVQIFLRYPYLLGGYISKRDKHFEDFLVHPEQVFFANIRSRLDFSFLTSQPSQGGL